MKSCFFSVLLVVTLFFNCQAQTYNSTVSQYFYNRMNFNPAYTGVGRALYSCFASYRAPQVSFEGAPRLISASLSRSFSYNMGLGLSLSSQSIGYLDNYRANMSYSYLLDLDLLELRLGIGLGMYSRKLRVSSMDVSMMEESLSSYQQQKNSYDCSFGYAIRIKSLEIGVSLPSVLATNSVYSYTKIDMPMFIFNVSNLFYFDSDNLSVRPLYVFSRYKDYQNQQAAGVYIRTNRNLDLYSLYNISSEVFSLGTSYKRDNLILLFNYSMYTTHEISNTMGGIIEFGLGYRFIKEDEEIEDDD